MLFGNREFMTDVRCPAINVIRNREKWTTSGTYLNGGGFARGSAYSHAMYTIAWNLMSPDEARKILDFYNGNYGQGPIYFLDDFALQGNVLPLHWSVPRLTAKDAPPLVKGVVVSETPLASYLNAGNYPSASATFAWMGTPNSDSVWIPVPKGQNFYFGARGSRTGTAQITMTRDNRTASVVTNLLTNPSMESTSGTVEVRRNLASDPRATANGGIPAGQARWAPRWFGAGGAGVTGAVTGATDGPEVAPGVKVGTYLRKTWTTGAGVGDTGFDHTPISPSTTGLGTTALPVTAGQTYTFSSFLRHSTANTGVRLYMRAVYRNAAGERIVGPSWAGAEVAAPRDTWVRPSFTVTAPADAVTVSVATDVGGSGSWAVGDTLDGTALLVEMSPVLGPYFDGSTSPDSDLTPSWTGTANASPSILTGVGVTGVFGGSNRVIVSSRQWAASGARSMRIIPTGAIPEIGGATVWQSSAADVGKTFTALATCRLSAPQTGNLDSRARALRFDDGARVTAPNEAGAYPLRLTFTVATAGQGLRLFNGATAGGGDVWWDNLALVEGTYTGPFFDGNTPNNSDVSYFWDGPVNASTSSTAQPADWGTGEPMSTNTTQRTNAMFTDPGGVTLQITGSGSMTLNSMYASIGTEPPPDGNFRSGEGHTGVVFDGVPQRTGYSAVIGEGLESVSSAFKEIGAWR